MRRPDIRQNVFDGEIIPQPGRFIVGVAKCQLQCAKKVLQATLLNVTVLRARQDRRAKLRVVRETYRLSLGTRERRGKRSPRDAVLFQVSGDAQKQIIVVLGG